MALVHGIECSVSQTFPRLKLNNTRTSPAMPVTGLSIIAFDNDELALDATESYQITIEESYDGGATWRLAMSASFVGGFTPPPGRPGRGGVVQLGPGATHVRGVLTPLSQNPTVGLTVGAA